MMAQSFTVFQLPEWTTIVTSINRNGDVAGVQGRSRGLSACFVRDRDGNITIFNDLSTAYSINSRGDIAGSIVTLTGQHGCLRSISNKEAEMRRIHISVSSSPADATNF